MRDAAFACIRRIGVDTGGSNIQFAVNPANGEMVVIEMNPRVSRCSALASKATGFPIAKIAARLAVGYRLDEIINDITGETPASFEPTIDYVVTKVPRWAFEKLPGASPVLGTQMQSVGEVMAIGRTFTESLQKALRSLETGRLGPQLRPDRARVRRALATDDLVRMVAQCRRPSGCSCSRRRCGGACRVERLHEATGIDPWFLDQIAPARRGARVARGTRAGRRSTRRDWRRVEAAGLRRRAARLPLGRRPRRGARRRASPPASQVTYKTVDTCAAEFAARTPYHYGTYEDEDEVAPLDRARRS